MRDTVLKLTVIYLTFEKVWTRKGGFSFSSTADQSGFSPLGENSLSSCKNGAKLDSVALISFSRKRTINKATEFSDEINS